MQHGNVVLQKRKLLSLTQHISLTFPPLHLCSSKRTHHSPLRIEALVTCQRRTYSDVGSSKNPWGKTTSRIFIQTYIFLFTIGTLKIESLKLRIAPCNCAISGHIFGAAGGDEALCFRTMTLISSVGE